MEPDPLFWAGKRVCVTGGTGFLGWHLVRQLLALTSHVRVFGMRPQSQLLADQLQALDCVDGDVRDAMAVRRALDGCQIVFHAAGPVADWGPALKEMRAIHVEGTRQVLQALPGPARLVHTSSVVTIGATRNSEVLTEAATFNLQSLKVDYVHVKKEAEDLTLEAASRGIDAVVVNPAYLIGPEDYGISLMGRLSLRFWQGMVPVIPPGATNVVDVRDVARGHLLAAEHGRTGCRYILGGENRTSWDFVHLLAAAHGMSMRWRIRVPGWFQTMLACLMECRSALVKCQPYPSLHYARMSGYRWYYSSARATQELGYQARPLPDSIRDTHEWMCANGLLK